MEFIKLVLVSVVVAVPIAFWTMNKWLNSFAYRIHISWLVLGLASLLSIIIAHITVSAQAVKAARANPVKSLKTE